METDRGSPYEQDPVDAFPVGGGQCVCNRGDGVQPCRGSIECLGLLQEDGDRLMVAVCPQDGRVRSTVIDLVPECGDEPTS